MNPIETILLKHADAINNKSVSLREVLEEAYEAGKNEAVDIIKEELRNAPLEVQMTKGVIFGKVIKALQDNK